MGKAPKAWGSLGAAAALTASVVIAVVAGAPPTEAQAPEPTVTVEPAHDLVDGDWVTVTVSGLQPGTEVGVAQCRAGALNHNYYCDTSDRVYSRATSEGTAEAQLRVDAILTVGSPGDPDLETTDCRVADACTIGVVERISAVLTPAPLHFNPDAEPAPPAVLTVTPDSELEDLQTVTATATGLIWSNRGYLVQCAANPTSLVDDCTRRDLTYFQTTDGQLTHDYQVDAVIDTETHGTVDCQVPGSCVLVVTQDQLRTPGRAAIAPLSFGPASGEEPPDGSEEPGT